MDTTLIHAGGCSGGDADEVDDDNDGNGDDIDNDNNDDDYGDKNDDHEAAAISARSVYTIQPCAMLFRAKPHT